VFHRNLSLKVGAVLLAIFLWFWVTINATTARRTSAPSTQPPAISMVAARTVPVVLRTKGALAPGLRPASVQVEPPVVTIIGPSPSVGAVSEVQTDVLDLATVSDGTPIELSLAVPVGIDVPNSATARVTLRLESAEEAAQSPAEPQRPE